MKPLDYVRIIRHRWWVLLIGLFVGATSAFVTSPPTDAAKAAPRSSYKATHTLITTQDGSSGSAGSVDYDRLALLTIKGPVPGRVADELKFVRWPTILRQKSESSSTDSAKAKSSQKSTVDELGLTTAKNLRRGNGVVYFGYGGSVSVSALPDPATGSLAIIASAPLPDVAVKIANLTAAELVKYLKEDAQQRFSTQLLTNTAKQQKLQDRLRQLDALMAKAVPGSSTASTLDEQISETVRELTNVQQTLADLNDTGPTGPNLTTLEKATSNAATVVAGKSKSAVGSSQRVLFGGLLGMVAGIAVLLLIEILSARLRDISSAEAAARMPAIAEIPLVKLDRGEKFKSVAMVEPSSLVAEAYRSFRTSLLAMWARHPKNYRPFASPDDPQHEAPELRILLITSPGPAEGKSISSVNLAAAFAETGQTVLVIDADFRRPQIHRYFDHPATPSLDDITVDVTPAQLAEVVQESGIPGVRFIASASPKSDPGRAMQVAKAAARAGTELADVVILDSSPILLANDAADLATFADGTVLLARSGWTRRSSMVAAAELLRRIEATVVGIVLVGAEHSARAGYYGYYGYYGYGYGYGKPQDNKRLMPWSRSKAPNPTRPLHASTARVGADAPGGSDAPDAPHADSET